MMFAVCVTFQIVPAEMTAFMPLMLQNAATSREQEPGCHRFDVLTDEARPDHVFLYELYTDSAAFDVHCASSHFQAFNTATNGMIIGKEVATWARVAT
jgi:(4S)-4-hydroxy-5-phosphonooxypentane-2,3-dione isomerase